MEKYINQCAELSKVAYSNKEYENLKEYEFTQLIEVDNVQAIICYETKHKEIYIAFRGTEFDSQIFEDVKKGNFVKFIEFIKDLGNDVDIRQEKYKNGIVHKGFFDAWKKIESKLLFELHKKRIELGLEDCCIYICGHSLGAALSVLCYLEIVQKEKTSDDVFCVNFGQPKLFCKKNIEYLESVAKGNYVRVRNNLDIITFVPFIISSVFAAKFKFKKIKLYRHAKDEYFFDCFGNLHRKINFFKRIYLTALNFIFFSRETRMKNYALDHDINEYITKVNRNI